MLMCDTKCINTNIDTIVSMAKVTVMRQNEKIPTASETYDSLMKLSETVNRALRTLGKIEGENALGSEEELRNFILSTSRKICEHLPIHQLENEELEHAESVLSHRLALAEDPDQFKTNDFEVVG